jgi:hypothetical protein
MKTNIFLIALCSLVLFGCPSKPIEFCKKEFVIKGSNPVEKIETQVPCSCDKWENGVKANIDAAVKYAGQEASLKGSFEKINLISQFSDRLKAITTAQCKINQTSITFDPNVSDQVFFNEIVKNYTEYQKIADLQTAGLTADQKGRIVDALLNVYQSVYELKKDELISIATDLKCTFKVSPTANSNVEIYRNNSLLQTVSLVNTLTYTIGKSNLVPAPNESIVFKFRLMTNGTQTSDKTYTLSELQTMAKNNLVTIELN